MVSDLEMVEMAVLAHAILRQACVDVLGCLRGRRGEIVQRERLDELSAFFHSDWCNDLLDCVDSWRWCPSGPNGARAAWLIGLPRDGVALFYRVLYGTKREKFILYRALRNEWD